MDKITSRHIKLALLEYFRYRRQFIVSTEVFTAGGIGDIVAHNDKTYIEVEIKISKSDLYNELRNKKHKHNFCFKEYDNGHYRVPNKFYFCVPIDLVDKAKSLIKKLNPKYGLMVYLGDSYHSISAISVIKPAGYIHKNSVPEIVKYKILKRLSSEVIGFYKKELKGINYESD